MYSALRATSIIFLALLLGLLPAAVAQNVAELRPRTQLLLGSYEGQLGGRYPVRLQLSTVY